MKLSRRNLLRGLGAATALLSTPAVWFVSRQPLPPLDRRARDGKWHTYTWNRDANGVVTTFLDSRFLLVPLGYIGPHLTDGIVDGVLVEDRNKPISVGLDYMTYSTDRKNPMDVRWEVKFAVAKNKGWFRLFEVDYARVVSQWKPRIA